MLGRGDRRVPDVGADVLDRGVVLQGDRHVGVPEGVRVHPLGDAVERGPGVRGDAAQLRVEVDPRAARARAGGQERRRARAGAPAAGRVRRAREAVAFGEVVGQRVADEFGDVHLAVQPALAQHAQHVVAAGAVAVAAVEPGDLRDPQARG